MMFVKLCNLFFIEVMVTHVEFNETFISIFGKFDKTRITITID